MGKVCRWLRWEMQGRCGRDGIDESQLLSLCNIVSRIVVMVIHSTSSKSRFHENKFV